jgi:3-oxoacyl-[acyl-carrier protein] reductase
MELKEKKIIVTGGANGIGKALVRKLIQEGATVGVFDKSAEALAILQNEFGSVQGSVCDVTDCVAVEAAVDGFFERNGAIHGLVNNAGIIHNEMLITFSKEGLQKHRLDTWDQVVATNLTSVFNLTRHVVYRMFSTRTKGVIVNVSSITAAGNIGQSVYSATKAAISALTVTWAKELGPMGIRVGCVAPGFTSTETTEKTLRKDIMQEWVGKTPLKRLATADEIADGILFILKNDFYNGRVLHLDGGVRL